MRTRRITAKASTLVVAVSTEAAAITEAAVTITASTKVAVRSNSSNSDSY